MALMLHNLDQTEQAICALFFLSHNLVLLVQTSLFFINASGSMHKSLSNHDRIEIVTLQFISQIEENKS